MSKASIVVDTAVAAHYAGVSPATVRSWAHRPGTGVQRYPAGYDLAELDAYLARRNTRMIRSRVAA